MRRWLERASLGAALALGGCAGGAPRAPSGVVLVCLDTLRADRLGALGHPGGLTPNLDRFASEGVVYSQAYAQANETVLSHASMFTGRDPSSWGAFHGDYALPEDARTLAGMLHGAGWQTGAVVAGGHMTRAFGFDAGFDTYDDELEWGSLADTGPRALAWLDGRESLRPFFLFVHAYDTHDRYLKPTPFGYSHADPRLPGFGRDLGRTAGAASQVADHAWLGATDALERLAVERRRFDRGKGARTTEGAVPLTQADLGHLAGLYDGSVAWADAAFGLFMADLDARGLLDDAWVVVMADHGHELGEHGSFHHRFALNDATLHVPLMVRPPGGLAQAQRIDDLTELVDLMPSLLAVAGVSAPEGIRGRSLYDGSWGAPGRSVVHAEGRLRLLSVRNQSARLTAEGWPADEPGTVGAWSTAEVDGVAIKLEGDPQQGDALRSALVDWRRSQPGTRP